MSVTTKQNYKTKLGLGYEEAKFNYLEITANFLAFEFQKKQENNWLLFKYYN